MEKNRVKFGFLLYDDMLQKISDGTLDQFDIIFTKDTKETFIISEDLEPKSIKSKVYTFSSVTEAIQELNKNTDTYNGQLVSISNGDTYEGYIVNFRNGVYTVSPLIASSSVDYNELGNKPIINLKGQSDNPIIVSDLENGSYSITGHFKIARNDLTINLNPNPSIFIIGHNEDSKYIKKIATKEIVDYIIHNESSVIINQYITESFLKEKGYATTSYVDEKIVALDYITKEEMSNYVEELIQSVIDTQLVPIVDEHIDKKIIGATKEQIISLFAN